MNMLHTRIIHDLLSIDIASTLTSRLDIHSNHTPSRASMIIAEAIENDLVGFWESSDQRYIAWVRIFDACPIYAPVALSADGRKWTKVPSRSYRAIALSLNQALLSEEGYS